MTAIAETEKTETVASAPSAMELNPDKAGWQLAEDGMTREPIDHSKGYTNLVMCNHPGCTSHRWVKSSDLFQVKFCRLHQKEAAKRLRNEARRLRVAASKPPLTTAERINKAISLLEEVPEDDPLKESISEIRETLMSL